MVIRDLAGKVVRSEGTVHVGEFILHKEELSPGYYFLELNGEHLFRGKIVVE
jgi:hypothetical protein